MKTLTIIVALLCVTTISTFAQKGSTPSSAIKIGMVDIPTVVKEMPEAITAEKELMDKGAKFRDTLTLLQKQLTDRLEEYKKQEAMLNVQAKQEFQKELQGMQERGMRYQEEKFGVGGDVEKIRMKLMAPIQDKVQKAISMVAAEEKLTFVFDKASQFVLYADDQYDLTFKVIDKIKRGLK
jgi:outer membrane protein